MVLINLNQTLPNADNCIALDIVDVSVRLSYSKEKMRKFNVC